MVQCSVKKTLTFDPMHTSKKNSTEASTMARDETSYVSVQWTGCSLVLYSVIALETFHSILGKADGRTGEIHVHGD